jgi:prepilin-type N-terminal cleavage/methylation domain-containing protein
MRSGTRNERGFTIFELIVVLGIIGILAMVLYPKMQNRELSAKIQATEMDMLRIYEACEAWKANNGQPNFTGLTYAGLGGLWDTTKTNAWGTAYTITLNNAGGPNASVLVNSGTLPDTTTRDQLIARFGNKGYTTASITTPVSFTFRAPY